jgi:guanylate kinase
MFAIPPVVFCGPSGVGKGTLIEMLQKRFPNDQFGFSVSHTTRGPRDGELDGVHYNFTTVEGIQAEIAAGKFIEYAEVHGRYYGTSVDAVASVQSAGKVCILDIDVQGVQNVKKSSLECKYVFIAPPSMEALEARLRGRGTEKEEDIQTRLGNAQKELDYGKGVGNFDIVLENDNLEVTFEKLCKVMKGWYPHLQSSFRPRPVVFCGPSGVGKGTLIKMLMDRFPDTQFGFSVSHTTRQPREGEENGVHYNFTTVEAMKKEIEEGKFIEHAEVHGNYYGTR